MKHECEGKREQNVENLKKKTKGKRTQATIEKRKEREREATNANERTNKIVGIRGEISPNAETTTPKLHSSRFRTNGVPKNAAWLGWLLAHRSRNTAKRREIDDYYTLGFFFMNRNSRPHKHPSIPTFLVSLFWIVRLPSIEHRRSRYLNEITLNVLRLPTSRANLGLEFLNFSQSSNEPVAMCHHTT